MRALAIGAGAFSAAVFAANYVLPSNALIPLAIALVIAGILLLLARRKWLRAVVISVFSIAFGLTVFAAYTARTTLPAKTLSGQTLEMDAVLLDYPIVYDGYCRAEVRLTGELPHLKALLYDNNKDLVNAEPGAHLHFTAKLKAADTRYGKDYDYYNSKGIYLTASGKSNIGVDDEALYLPAIPAKINKALAGRISEIFPDDTAGFMRSVMLGDKSELYNDLPHYTALTRAGFMHIAAVSGMHVAFLVSLILLVFGKSRRSSLGCIVLLWCFVLVTGATPSAVRAGFMQSLLLLAPVFRRENDPATSLTSVLALILLVNPHAAASVSLQLSFGAMAGILCFSSRINALFMSLVHNKRLRRALRYPIGAAASSLAVMVFTVPLTAIHFGYVSVLSPIMNIFALWAVSLCFCGGFIACALSLLSLPVACFAAALVSVPVHYIYWLAGLISKVPFALVYLENAPCAWWLVVSYIFIIAAAFSRVKAVYKLTVPAALSLLSLLLVLTAIKLDYQRGDGCIAVLDVGQGQSIAVTSPDSSVLIDCGGGAKQRRAGETAAAYLISRGRTELDALVLTHLHADHANGVAQLMEMVDVKRIIMPKDRLDGEWLLEPILASAARHDTEITYISADTNMSIGGVELELFAPQQAGDANERGLMCIATLGGDYDVLVTGDAPFAAERKLLKTHDIEDTEVYVVGHHGSKYSSCDELVESIGADTAVISVGYNTYGHPTQEVLDRLAANDYNVYRTDLDGCVELRVW